MPNLPKGTIVADAQCEACGGGVKVKLDKNSKCYFICHHYVGDAPCGFRASWGREDSNQMQRDYLAARKSGPAQPAQDAINDEPPQARDKSDKTPTDDGDGDRKDRDDGDVFAAFGG